METRGVLWFIVVNTARDTPGITEDATATLAQAQAYSPPAARAPWGTRRHAGSV